MNAASFRLAVSGLTHGHVWSLVEQFSAVPAVRLVAVADATDLLDEFMLKFDRSHADWRELLAANDLDGVLITSNTVESSEMAIKFLEKGLHVFLEKPMAIDGPTADRILAAWRASGKTLMVNWPIFWTPGHQAFRKLVRDEAAGTPFHFRFRIGHRGPKEIGCNKEFTDWLYNAELNGGGAIGDFGHYGAALAREFLGIPQTVYAVAGNYTKEEPVADDHAIVLLGYPKASAVLEATWATQGFDSSANPVLHGSKATLGQFGNEVEVAVPGSAERVVGEELKFANPAAYFLDLIERNAEAEGMLNPVIAADAARIIAAARKSLETGCAVALD